MAMAERLYLIPLFPLLGFLVNGLLGRRLGDRCVSWVGCLSSGAAFFVSAGVVGELLKGHDLVYRQTLWTFLEIAGLRVDVALAVDRIAAVMLMVVTGVGSLIHLFSTGYMKGDGGYARFFAYLNLFMFAMLLLVMGDNLIIMFVGWEGVGLCSYLLIGFWYQDDANAAAGKKAFIVNRIGDFAFVLAILACIHYLGTVEFARINAYDFSRLAPGVVGAITLLLFVGATGKSAQLPLYVWLPDAMAGPTPVSALIHAATMVTAGVYMIARLGNLFAAAPLTLTIVAWVGALTAIFAATMALAQSDIKKVLAYSTISQLGYMFLAMGLGAYSAGLFHLMTHAFFKACLFLGAGAVILGCHHEQNLFRLGGLARRMPVTHLCMLIATLAIAGFPFLSGFFSKDAILFQAYEQAPPLYALGLLTALLTAFYMFRLYLLTFRGPYRGQAQPHEVGGWMPAVLLFLAMLSIVGGWVGIPHGLGGDDPFHQWLAAGEAWREGILPEFDAAHLGAERLGMALATGVFLVAAAAGLFCYGSGAGQALVRRVATGGPTAWAYQLLKGKYYVDELYYALFVYPLLGLAVLLWQVIDRWLIDRFLVEGCGRLALFCGHGLSFFHGGRLGTYAAYTFVFTLLILWFFRHA